MGRCLTVIYSRHSERSSEGERRTGGAEAEISKFSVPTILCSKRCSYIQPLMNTKQVGEKSEAYVIAALLRAGKVVLQPFGDNQRYDVVVDENGKFTRIQVKTARVEDGAVMIQACSKYGHRGGESRSYRGQADLFMAYCPDTDKIYVVPVSFAGTTAINLRLTPARNGQVKRVRFAKDFEFECWVAEMVAGI